MSKKQFLFLAALCGSYTLSAQSVNDSSPNDSTFKSLDQAVVTATKTPKKLSETGKIVTVIPRETIDRSAGKDLAQILNEQTGIIVNGANSNSGKDKTVWLRGASDKYTLILLDGTPLNDPAQLGGQYDIRLLPLNQIERVEILKGSQSTLYGSSAVAGVINVITRKATSEQTTGNGIISYGSYNSLKGAADFQKKGEILEYDLNYQYLHTDGIAEAKDTTGKANFPKNGYTSQGFQGKIGINVTDHFKLSPYFRYSEYKGTFSNDAFAGGSNAYDARLVNTGLTAHARYAKGTFDANYGYDYTQRAYGGTYPTSYQGRFHHGEAFVTHRFSDLISLVGGASFQTYTLVKPDTVNSIISPYASLFFKSRDSRLNVEVGGRYNHNNKYGSNFTYSFNPSYLIEKKVKVFANLSSGFRAPGVNELYGPFGANPNLKPEKAVTGESGVQLFLLDNKLTFLVDYFDRNIKDVIVAVYDPGTNTYPYINRDKQHDHGFEAELNYRAGILDLRASYAYVTGNITQNIGGKDTSFYNLQRRPKNNIQVAVGVHAAKGLYINTSFQITGKRYDYSFDPSTYAQTTINMGAYALWNAYAEYKFIGDNYRFFVDVKNILDKTNYYEAYGYSVQGTNVTVGIGIKL